MSKGVRQKVDGWGSGGRGCREWGRRCGERQERDMVYEDINDWKSGYRGVEGNYI